jgi:redox-sensitive bicupin YhaK (pirin superfamily)
MEIRRKGGSFVLSARQLTFPRSGLERGSCIDNHTVVLFEQGDELSASGTGDSGFRFLLVSGKPLGEPIAWQGPIILNAQAKLRTAFREYLNSTFIKHP